MRSPGEPLDSLFADGFESGDFSLWTVSSAIPGFVDLNVTSGAALADSYGMQVTINDTGALYVTDETPDSESSYYARFYFDPNSLYMGNGNHQIFQGYMETNGAQLEIFRIYLRKVLSAYVLDVYVRNDPVSMTPWLKAAAYQISDAVHAIEIEWAAARAPGANNGRMKLRVDGNSAGGISTVDNDAIRLDGVKLGAVSELDLGTSGTYCFDAVSAGDISH